jgi:hypothetical protein
LKEGLLDKRGGDLETREKLKELTYWEEELRKKRRISTGIELKIATSSNWTRRAFAFPQLEKMLPIEGRSPSRSIVIILLQAAILI